MRTLALLIAGLTAATAQAGETRRDWDASLLLHGTFRSASSVPGDGSPPAGFSTGFPYLGATVGLDAYPLRDGLLKRFGLGLGYTLSTARLDVTGGGLPEATIPAREQRFHLDVLAREPDPIAGFHLAARLGLAWQSFALDPHGALAPASHTAARIAVDVRRALGPVEARIVAGVRLGTAGEELERQLRVEGTATGFDARVLVSGPLESLANDLAWTAGWDWMPTNPDMAHYDRVYKRLIAAAEFSDFTSTFHLYCMGS